MATIKAIIWKIAIVDTTLTAVTLGNATRRRGQGEVCADHVQVVDSYRKPLLNEQEGLSVSKQ
ncbi:hypothetical protein KIMH_06730 [Bombiscardovia apis]|uniref:Secreted protein n=1 Tax=Bombiscardovia apis TaxID=2932182 RepID=A0ABM8BC90_9BIFI|nr:hypothetical protein KIMH_06480 [Bombiscardovia apis]BDR54562.1 hypothetical protein KIMH_06730 [Bombiscardovia apis]